MLNDCPRLGINSQIAILLGTNDGSIALLKKHGFIEWGRMPGIIEFEDKICDHLYYGIRLKE
jgi:L-amino acid N-acyltransferase YncA